MIYQYAQLSTNVDYTPANERISAAVNQFIIVKELFIILSILSRSEDYTVFQIVNFIANCKLRYFPCILTPARQVHTLYFQENIPVAGKEVFWDIAIT